MQHEGRAALGVGAQLRVEAEPLPALEQLRLALRQPGLHREIGLGQEQRLAPVAPGLDLEALRFEHGDERLRLSGLRRLGGCARGLRLALGRSARSRLGRGFALGRGFGLAAVFGLAASFRLALGLGDFGLQRGRFALGARFGRFALAEARLGLGLWPWASGAALGLRACLAGPRGFGGLPAALRCLCHDLLLLILAARSEPRGVLATAPRTFQVFLIPPSPLPCGALPC